MALKKDSCLSRILVHKYWPVILHFLLLFLELLVGMAEVLEKFMENFYPKSKLASICITNFNSFDCPYLSSADAPNDDGEEEEIPEDREDDRGIRGGEEEEERKFAVGNFTITCRRNPSPLSSLVKRFWCLKRMRKLLIVGILTSVGISASGFCICTCMTGIRSLSTSFSPIWSGLVKLGLT